MYNLQKLLNKHIIEIPVIQRDYAQGRVNPKVNGIRNGFIEALLATVSNPETNRLHLDFIYGKIESQSTQNVQENNYNHVESILAFAKAYTTQAKVGLSGNIPDVNRDVLKASKTKMMPLDGQQRITTLWLLHYVLYHQSSLVLPEWMKNLTYKTRKSSTSFINGLIGVNGLDNSSLYSEEIKKSKWFYKAWLQDPTVKGMLVTLDEIQKQLNERLITIIDNDIRNKVLEQWIEELVNIEQESAIQFSFLSLSDIDVDNDIYIKMNDRGKQLTDFEIFKNDLLAYLQDQVGKKEFDFTYGEYDEIAKNIDKKWHDVFWNEKGTDSFNIEHTFHYFFLYYLLLYRITNIKSDDSISGEYFSALVGDNRNSNFERFDFKELEKLNLISLDSLKYVFENLELLSDLKTLKTTQEIVDEMSFKKLDVPEFGEDFLKHFLRSDSGNIGYYDRVFNYAITCYLHTFKKDLDKELFKQWCRVLQNLIYNQAYIQDSDTFETAIKHVNILLDNGADIEATFLNKGQSLGVFPRQLIEEVRKVSLYKDDSSLFEKFVNLEKHTYFHGQIGFVIEMASNPLKGGFEFNKEFTRLSSKVSALFDPKFTRESNWLLQRALMTKGFEFKPRTSNRLEIFSNNPTDLRLKEEGWRWLFKNDAAKDYFGIFNSFLKDLNVESFESDLNDLVNEYKIKDWRYYFIKEPETIRACTKRMIKKNNNEEVRLLKNPTANGYYSELRTKYFEHNFNNNIKPFDAIKYHLVKDQQQKPCCYFTGWNRTDFNYHLDVRYFDSQYQIKFLNINESNQHKVEQKVIDVLMLLDFNDDNQDGFIFNVNKKEGQDIDQIMNLKLVEVLSALKKLEL